MIKTRPKGDWDYEIPHLLHDEVAERLGGPHPNVRRRWKAFKTQFSKPGDIEWAKFDDNTDPVLEEPASPQMLVRIADHIEEGLKLTSEERLILHKGFLMIDGFSFSFRDNYVCMNGRQMPHEVPTVSILRVLSDRKRRVGWDLTRLLTVFGCVNTNRRVLPQQEFPGRREARLQFRLRRQLERRANVPNWHAVHSVLSWVGWMAEEHIPPPKHHILHPLAAWSRDIQQRLNRSSGFNEHVAEAFLNHPNGLSELDAYPWLERWKRYKGTRQSHAPTKPALRTTGGKLKLRVRTKNGTSRHTNVPDDPEIWASLLSLTLSPLTSHQGEMLFAVQYNWTSRATSVKQISAPLKRSIEFLNSIITANSTKAYISGRHILVIGRLGHFYEVTVEPGAHLAPFKIKMISALDPKHTSDICIHQGRFHSTLPIGDTIASVVLSLLDDVGSCKQIHSLLEEMNHFSPLGHPVDLGKEHLAMLNQASLAQFKVHINRHHGANEPFWVEGHHRDAPDLQREDAYDRGRVFMEYLQHRNRRNHRQRNHNDSNGASKAVAHALAAGRPFPTDSLVKMWKGSLGSNKPSESRPQIGQRMENYIDNFQRNEWMYLRNHAQDEAAAPIGDIRNGERRFCEIFPRLWEAMLLQPIGSYVRFAVADGGDVSFEHCRLNVTLRNAHERRLMLRFATLAGYEEQEGERGYQVFLRRDHPRQWARRNLSENLNRAQERFGFRGAPPWWWHYMDAQQAPAEVPEIRWELSVDLRDDRGPRMAGDFQP